MEDSDESSDEESMMDLAKTYFEANAAIKWRRKLKLIERNIDKTESQIDKQHEKIDKEEDRSRPDQMKLNGMK